MGKRRPELIRRQRAVERTMKRFGGKAFKMGANDCVKLARFHLKEMGHKLPSTGHYKTAAEAAKQLKKQGAKNLTQLLDKYLERIPPAAMILGDVAVPPSEPDAPAAKLGTIIVMASGHKFIGWHPDVEELAVMSVSEIDVAWRA
jgi:hypothetical protein